MHDRQLIEVLSQEFRDIFERIKVATRLSSKLSEYCMDETESIRKGFEELIGKSVGDSFTPDSSLPFGLRPQHRDRSGSLHWLRMRVHRLWSYRHRRPGDDRGEGQSRDVRSSRRAGQTAEIHHLGTDHHRDECLDRNCCHDPAWRIGPMPPLGRCGRDTRRSSGDARGGCPC